MVPDSQEEAHQKVPTTHVGNGPDGFGVRPGTLMTFSYAESLPEDEDSLAELRDGARRLGFENVAEEDKT